MVRITVATTSSALNGSPPWNTTPRRSVNRHRSGATICHEVASAGSSSSLRLRRTSGSNTMWWTLEVKLSTCAFGSNELTSPTEDHRRVCAVAGAANAKARHVTVRLRGRFMAVPLFRPKDVVDFCIHKSVDVVYYFLPDPAVIYCLGSRHMPLSCARRDEISGCSGFIAEKG
jgi:hypothetical protein